MKLTLSWLRDHLETSASLDEIVTKLSAIGLEVESVDSPAERLAAFRVARVVEAKPHPTAARLRVAQVEIEPGHRHHLGEEAGSRHRLQRHAVLGPRARAFR